MKKFILRRKTHESDEDEYEYLINSCHSGVNITTPFIDKATRYTEYCEVFVHGKGWEFIEIKK